MLIVAEEELHLKRSTWNTATYAPPMYLIVFFSLLMFCCISTQGVLLAVLPLYYVYFICLSTPLQQAEDASINKLLRPLLCACRLSAYNLVLLAHLLKLTRPQLSKKYLCTLVTTEVCKAHINKISNRFNC